MSNEYPAHTPGTDISSSVAARHVPTNVAQIIAVIMVVLALVGVGITLTNAAWAVKYWLLLVPTYGLLCTFAAWYHARALDRMVARQILHWTSVGIAIAVDFAFLRGSGEQTSAATGLSSLLILALGCLLAGVYMEWLFLLVGLLLLAIVIIVSMAQEYLVLVFLVGALVIVLILVAHRVTRKWEA